MVFVIVGGCFVNGNVKSDAMQCDGTKKRTAVVMRVVEDVCFREHMRSCSICSW